LLKLGIEISQATVAKYMVRQRKPPSQSWRTFLENHVQQLVATDFLVVRTVSFRLLFVLWSWAIIGVTPFTSTTHQPPATAKTHYSAAGVNSIAERSNNNNIRTPLDNVPLPSKPIGMRDVVGIHAPHYRSTRL
jgi:hypothetical protein